MFKRAVHLLRKFFSSLSFKLSFYASLIMFLAILAFSYHSISVQEENLIAKMIQGALKDSDVIKAAIWNGMMTKDREVIRQIVKTVGRQEGFKEINVYDAKGVLHYTSKEESAKKYAGLNPNPLLEDLSVNPSVRHRMTSDGTTLDVVNPLLNTHGCSVAGCHAPPSAEKILGALEVKLSLGDVKAEVAGNTRRTVVFAVVLFLVISSISGLAVVFLVQPGIRKLRDSAAKMARGEYSPNGASNGSDEMAGLFRAFDLMSRQVNERTRQLESSRRMYKALFDDVPCYLTVINSGYRIVRANRAFTVQFGDLVGRNCFTGYKGLPSRCSNCPVEKTFADGVSHQSEEVWNLGGDKAYVIVKTSPIFDENGEVSEVLEMSVDVTRLKRLQIELERKQQQFKHLFENVPCYLTVVDHDFNIIQANKLFEQDFGENIGKKCYRVYKNRDSKCDNCPVEKTFMDPTTHRSEETWERDGQPTYILVSTAPITNDRGEIVAVMEMSTNITESKRLQGELVVLGETIAGMSHNIKNILSGLQGGLYVVDSGLKRDREDRVRIGWTMVKGNVEKISNLVKGILYASKERQPEYLECDPGRLLEDVCSLFETKAGDDGIRFVRDFEPRMPACLLDPAGIHSALSNLISNAVEACRESKKGEGRTITARARIQGKRLVITIADDADGIPAEVKEKLFNKFYSTKGSKGTGLGLVITRKVVEEHGGTIKVESEPGHGTRFVIELPLRAAQGPDAQKAAV